MYDGRWKMYDGQRKYVSPQPSYISHLQALPLISKPFHTILQKNNDDHVNNNSERDTEPDAYGAMG